MDPRRSPAEPQTKPKKVIEAACSKKKKRGTKREEEDGVDITELYGADAHNNVAFDMEIQRLKRLQQAKEALSEGEVLSGLPPSSGPTLNWKGANKEAADKAKLAAEMRKLAPDERPSYTNRQRYGKSSSDEEDDVAVLGGDGDTRVRVGDYLKGVDANDHDTDSSEDEVQQVKRKHTNKKKKLMASLKQKGDVPTEEDESTEEEEEEESEDEDETEEEEESTEEDDDDDDDSSSSEGEDDRTSGQVRIKQRYANVTEAEAAAVEKEAMRVSDLVASIYNGTGNSFGEVDWGPDEVESDSSGDDEDSKGNQQPKKPKK